MESHGVGRTSPPLFSLLRDQTQPGLFFREREEAGNKVWSPWASGQLPRPLPSLLPDQTQPGLFSREKEETGNKVWSPWTSEQLPHASFPCCVTRLNQGYSLVRRKNQGTKFGVPGVGKTSPPLFSLLRDQTKLGLFSPEIEEEWKQSLESLDVGTTSSRLPSLLRDQTQPGLFSHVRKKKQGTKFGVLGRRDNFSLPPLAAA